MRQDAPRIDDSMKGQSVGPYRIVEEVGRGGMGRVYRAVRDDGTFTHEVAIKIVQPDAAAISPETLPRFRRERQLLAMLNHPNIASILDGGTLLDGRPYYVMEFVEGEPVTKYVFSNELPLEQRLTLFQSICEAVTHAHQRLIIHRDLKPANIMVRNDGTVKLLDFGIAKIFQPDSDAGADLSITQASSPRALTPSYAAPEQFRRDAVTTATDIYALGLILYELLTGRRAQQTTSSNLAEIERAVCEVAPPKLSDTIPGPGGIQPAKRLRGDLESIVSKAIHKDPAERYATVSQLSEDIQRYRNGYPVHSRPRNSWYAFKSYVKRNRLIVASGVITVLSLVAGMSVAIYQAQRAKVHAEAVRGLAKSLLNEINPALLEVPGTTKARHLLVKRSVEYLDRITAAAGNDENLLRETAEAYEQIATLQGNRNKSNLGDYPGAMESFRKALAIRDRIETFAPSLENKTWIALISAEASRVYPNSPEALEMARRSVAIGEKVRDDNNRRIAHVYPNTLFGLGYLLTVQERADEAITQFAKAREIFVAIKRRPNALALCDRYTGINMLMLGRTYESQHYFRRAETIEAAFVQSNNTPRAQMDHSYNHQGIAESLAVAGKWDEALPFMEKAHATRVQLAAKDPSDTRTTTGLADSLEVLAFIHAGLKRRAEALAGIEKAIQAREQIAAKSPDSPEDQYELARVYMRAGRIDQLLGRCAEAKAWFERAKPTFDTQKRDLSNKLLREALSELESCR